MSDSAGSEHPPARLLIDCDPGIDDAIAITLALGHETAELVGITTVAGNVGLPLTTANALRMTQFLGHPEVPVVAGSAEALVRTNVFADYVHGVDGLGGAPLPPAQRAVDPGWGPDTIIELVEAAHRDPTRDDLTLVAVGPLTNLALALRKQPKLTSWVRDVVIMGGSYTRGNVTPAAEFNIFVDPEAAAVVFAADWSPVLIGLDLTLQARVDATVMDRWRGYGPLSDDLLVPSLGSYFDSRSLRGRDDEDAQALGPAIHDACAVAFALAPDLFTTRPAFTQVETQGRLTSGMTVVDFEVAHDQVNSRIATEIDVEGFWRLMEAAFTALAATMPAGRSRSTT